MEFIAQAGADSGKTFKVDRPYMVVGRQVGNDIQINDSQISRRHLQVESRDGVTYVTDLNSANGTFINDRRLAPNQPEILRSGDVLRLGDTLLLARSEPAATSSSEATQIGGAYSAQTQVVRPAPIPPNSNPSYDFPNSSPNAYPSGGYVPQNPASGYSAQNPAGYTPQSDYQAGGYAPQSQNQSGGYAPQNQYQAGGYNSQPYASQQPSGYNSQPYASQQSGYNTPNQPLTPGYSNTQAQPVVTRRGPNTGLIAAIVGVVLIALIAALIILFLGGSHNSGNATPTVQAAANATVTSANASPTLGKIVLPSDTPVPANNAPVPTVTPKPQAKPTDTPKPQPTATPKPQPTNTPKPKPTDTPKPVATTTVANTTSASSTGGFVLGNPDTPVPSNGGSGGNPTEAPTSGGGAKTTAAGSKTTAAASSGTLTAVSGLGVTISFPSNWQHEVNTDKDYILGEAPDNVTYVEIVKSNELTGSVSDRLNTVLDSVKQDSPDLKIVQQVKTSSDGSTASVEYTYTSSDDNILRQETLVCVDSPDDDTISYVLVFSAAKSNYANQEQTFSNIAKSFDFTS